MNIQEILQEMQEKYDAAMKAESAEERNAIMDEFDALKEQKESIERMVEAEKAMVMQKVSAGEMPKAEDSYKQHVHEFAQAARRGFKQAMSEGTPAAGGYTVPEDILTRVNQYRTAKASLEDLVSKENVTTMSGARTFQKRSTQQGFASVEEGGKIPLKATPEFERLVYQIVKYGGVFAVTDELLADSDANIVNILTAWIADEGRVTRNKLVLATLDEKYTRAESPETAKEIAGLDDIKTIVNVDLGQAFAPTSRIVTNDYGLDWLDHLKTEDGDYVLKRHNNDPLDRVVSAGSLLIPVTVIPATDLANDGSGKYPFYIGDIKEGAHLFDRQLLTIKASDTAYMANTASGTGDNSLNAFQEDLTLFRAIERLDCVLRDEMAFFKGFVDPSQGSTGTGNAG